MYSPLPRLAHAALGLCALAVAACSNSTSPGIQPEVVNQPDSFQYQITAIRNYSGVQNFDWQNTGTQANVDQSAALTAGTATLEILDADGTAVYTRSLADNGSFTSAAGTPGTWTIRVTYADTDATVNFRVQKAT